MASAFAPWWRRALYHVPGLFVVCPDGNYHLRWRRICCCARGCNGWGDFVRLKDRWLPISERPWVPVGGRWWNISGGSRDG